MNGIEEHMADLIKRSADLSNQLMCNYEFLLSGDFKERENLTLLRSNASDAYYGMHCILHRHEALAEHMDLAVSLLGYI